MTKSTRVALQDLKLDRLIVVYPGSASYPIHLKATAMPLAAAWQEINGQA